MSIHIEKETGITFDFSFKTLINEVICCAIEEAGLPYEAEINVILTDNEAIREVNKEYRGIDAPTDVLSFPMLDYITPGDFSVIDEADPGLFNPDTGELLLGDMMISLDKVLEQADAYGHSVKRELAFLVVHSMLHLFGYDHMTEEERKIMEDRQRTILEQLKITRDS